MSATATRLITAEQLLKMGDVGRCELIYGRLVKMSRAGFEHGTIAARFARHLSAFVEDHQLGLAQAAETRAGG